MVKGINMVSKKQQRKGIAYNILMLYIINIAKVVFPLITLPFLTRVLTMDCYGVVAYVKAIMSYMQLIVNFGFMYSGVKEIANLQDDLKNVGKITGNVIIAKCMLSIFCLIVIITLSFTIDILQGYFIYVILSFIPVFLSTFLMEFLFRGIEQMQIIAIRYLVMKSISIGMILIIVKDDSDILWIPVLEILGYLVAIIITCIEIKKIGIRIDFKGAFKGGINAIKSSSVYFTSDIASTAFGAFNTVIVGIVLDNKEVAIFSVCMQLVSAVQTLYSPIYNGIYPQMVKKKDLSIIKRVLKVFIPIIALGCVFTLLSSKYILYIIAGESYMVGASVLSCFVPVLFFSFLVMLLGWPTLGAIDRVKETTKTTVIAALTQIMAVAILVGTNNLTLVSIAIIRCFTEVMMLLMRLYYFNKYKKEFI